LGDLGKVELLSEVFFRENLFEVDLFYVALWECRGHLAPFGEFEEEFFHKGENDKRLIKSL